MKVLSIGNSFSQDAHRWLHKLAEVNGENIETTNLYIGGCSLETHFKNMQEDNEAYELRLNGGEPTRNISIAEALKMEKWDVVTVQQVSGLSGIYKSYEPYLSALVQLIRETNPQAKLYFHETWAYEIDSTHSSFKKYHNNQKEMFRCIKKTSKKAAKSIDATIIPVGEVIQKVRGKVKEFNYKKGGLSLCRDGFHLSYDYGRFTAAAIWLRTLTGKKVEVCDFEDFDPALLQKILKIVNKKP